MWYARFLGGDTNMLTPFVQGLNIHRGSLRTFNARL